MAIYAHKCRGCGAPLETTTREVGYTCGCGENYRRDYSGVRFGQSLFVPHHNWAVGRYVNSQGELDDAFKSASDDQSERTGIDHQYTQLSPGDRPAPTSAMEGVEKRERVFHDAQ